MLLLVLANLFIRSSISYELNSKRPPLLPNGYHEIFFEDFTSFKTSIWNIEVGNGQGVNGDCDTNLGCPNLPGFGNGEIEFYSPENVLVHSDNLLLFSTFNKTTRVWNSGRINSMGKFSFTYGLIEARLKVSDMVKGIFPAFWLLPENLLNGRGWPYNGEIDVFEFLLDWNTTDNGIIQYHTPSTFHFGAHFSKTGIQFTNPPNPTPDDYHIYAVDWQPQRMIVLRDGEIIGIFEKPFNADWFQWPFDYPFHLICNMAIQPGESSAADSSAENQFLAIDWIRVSQKYYK
jgi:beta-glucanase (GH16 family)